MAKLTNGENENKILKNMETNKKPVINCLLGLRKRTNINTAGESFYRTCGQETIGGQTLTDSLSQFTIINDGDAIECQSCLCNSWKQTSSV